MTKIRLDNLRILLILAILLFIRCGKLIETNEKDSIKIDFPLNKTCIYGSASYEEKSDFLQLVHVAIFSLKFDNIYQSDDTTYYSEQTTRYYPDSFGVGEEYLKNGEILLAKDKKWVYLQNTELNSVSNYVLFKKNSNTADTTDSPTEGFEPYPIYPRNIKTDRMYSVFRPDRRKKLDHGLMAQG